MNWKYFLFDLFKVIVPVLVAQLFPEGAPKESLVEAILYVFALILGLDSIQKTVRAVKRG